jgi:hypothetical protein
MNDVTGPRNPYSHRQLSDQPATSRGTLFALAGKRNEINGVIVDWRAFTATTYETLFDGTGHLDICWH